LQFALSILICVYLGGRLDERWGTTPTFAVLGLAIGFAAGFYSLYKGVYGSGDGRPPRGPPGR
jgi:F0F1-type ATP synthase assembly protein I